MRYTSKEQRAHITAMTGRKFAKNLAIKPDIWSGIRFRRRNTYYLHDKHNRYLVSPVVRKEADTSNGNGKRKHRVEENGWHEEVHDVSKLVSHIQAWSLEKPLKVKMHWLTHWPRLKWDYRCHLGPWSTIAWFFGLWPQHRKHREWDQWKIQ